MPETDLHALLDDLPTRPDESDRTIVFVAIDTPSDQNPDLAAVGAAIGDALTTAGVDLATQVQYLAYTLDVEEASEGWRTGDRLTPDPEA